MNERDIQISLFRKFNNGWKVACPNMLFYYTWESDVLAVTRSGYLVEYEIKISVSDYKADFNKKRKHFFLTHQQNKKSPNRFYYVVTEDVCNKITVPDYSGLIVIKERCRFPEIIKKAPKLHGRKADTRALERLYHSLYYRAWSNIVNETKIMI